MAELVMNGMLEEEVRKYYHICFYTDKKGPEPDNDENYIFVPKVVCRYVDDGTVCIQDWYVYKKNLSRFIRHKRRTRYLQSKESSFSGTATRKENFYNPKQSSTKSHRQ